MFSLSRRQALPSGCSHPEPEPVPPSIDNWARGAIPCKQASSLPCTPPSPSPRSNNDGEDPQVEQEAGGGQNSVPTQEIDNHTGGRGGEGGGGGEHGKGAAQRGTAASPPGSRVHRAADNHNAGGRDQGDGRAWGGGDGEEEGEGEIMELLRTLSDGDHHGGEEVLAGAGGIGDAIGRGRQHEERVFLEVRSAHPFHTYMVYQSIAFFCVLSVRCLVYRTGKGMYAVRS